jgi:NADPH:quinone reductase-like Zn-dependent oxidoreductase
MRAVMFERSGSTSGLVLREVPDPVPGAGEVLVRIHATTVTQGDVVLRRMPPLLARLFGIRRKRMLGHEYAGVVAAVGDAESHYRPGDRVFGTTTGLAAGACAEAICVPGDGIIAEIPNGLRFEEAAPIPVGALTALTLLRRGGADEVPGRRILVYGASGSVGSYAVQLGLVFGGRVTGVSSTANLDLVRSLGAERVIDYTRDDVLAIPERFDVIVDAVGKGAAGRARRLLAPGGRLVSVRSSTTEHPADLWYLRDLLEAGSLRAAIDRTYPLEAIREAHEYVEQGHKKGNVVIAVRPGPRKAMPAGHP